MSADQRTDSAYDFDFGTYEPSILSLAFTDEQSRGELAVSARWFRRGMVWMYGYNHDEAVACFQLAHSACREAASTAARVVELLCGCFVAYCEGPNYNKPWSAFADDQARVAAIAKARTGLQLARTALSRLDGSGVEHHALLAQLVDCLAQRYGGSDASVPSSEALAAWTDSFADGMAALWAQHSVHDLDLATVVVEALVNRTPWALWDLRSGQPQPGASTLQAVAMLEQYTQGETVTAHPGLLHMYIHVMEQSPYPQRALRAADALRQLVPDAGHLCHMPSHIDVLCGHYYEALQANQRAIDADRKYLRAFGARHFYTLYVAHDSHFKLYAAFFLGQYSAAMDAARQLEAVIDEPLLRVADPPMADWLESFLSVKLHCLVRFGKWHDIAALPYPADAALYCVTTAMTHYAKGVAAAASGDVERAEHLLHQLVDSTQAVPASRTLFNNSCRDLLAIAEQMLRGELEYRKQNYTVAFDHLRRAIALEDGLPYDEPWGWMQPVRHAYGALNLEQGNVDEALRCYQADLGFDDTLQRASHHPNNVWSLIGYVECLKKLGRCCEAKLHQQQLDIALARADVKIAFSCFCRQH